MRERRLTARPERLYSALGVPGLLLLVVLFVFPMLAVVAFSFGTDDILGRPTLGFSLENYDNALQPFIVPVLVRTFEFALLTTAICLVLGYPVAYFAHRFAGRYGTWIIAALVLTWLVDYLVRIFAWTTLLDDQGLINDISASIGLGRHHLLNTRGATVLGLVYGYLPLMILPIFAALGNFDSSQIDAGKDLYGTPVSTFFHVTLPATRRGVVGGVLLVYLPVLGDFATAQFLGGVNSSMIGNLINTSFADGGSISFGSALTVAVLVLLVAGLALVVLLSRSASGFSPRRLR